MCHSYFKKNTVIINYFTNINVNDIAKVNINMDADIDFSRAISVT